MKTLLTLAIMTAALSGCLPMQQQSELLRVQRDEQIDDAEGLAIAGKRICTNKRHAGVFKTLAESAYCSNPIIISSYERVKFPYMDLVKEYTQKRLEILQARDKKKITEEQCTKEMSESLIYLTAESHIRDLEGQSK